MPDQLSAERPLITQSELERMLFELWRCEQEGPPTGFQSWASSIILPIQAKSILADERLKGHYGYVGKEETKFMHYQDLYLRICTLRHWLEKWAGKRHYPAVSAF